MEKGQARRGAEQNAADLGISVEEYLEWLDPAKCAERTEARVAAARKEDVTGEIR